MDKEKQRQNMPKIGVTHKVKRYLKQLKKLSKTNLKDISEWPVDGLADAIENLVTSISKDNKEVQKTFEEETKILQHFEELYDDESETVVDILIQSLKFNEDDEIRKSAAHVIGFLKIAEAQEAIAGCLMGDPYSATREKAAYALGEFDSLFSLEPLIYAIENDSNYWVRAEAAWALGKVQSEEASLVLVKALNNDSEGWVRTSIAAALGEFSEDVIPALLEAYTKEENMQVRKQIEKTVEDLRKKEKD